MIYLTLCPDGYWVAYLDPEPGTLRGSDKSKEAAVASLLAELFDRDYYAELYELVKDKIKEDR